MAKKVTIGTKPTNRKSVTPDEWVSAGASTTSAPPEKETPSKIETMRYTIDIPRDLHAKIKSYCALNKVKMNEEVVFLLQKHFDK